MDVKPTLKPNPTANVSDINKPTEQKQKKEPKPKKEPTVRKSAFAALYPDTAPLKVLTEKNPKKAGSKAFEHFEKYTSCKTVGEARAKGAIYNNIAWDVGHGLIKIG
jgi:hypothetical protein